MIQITLNDSQALRQLSAIAKQLNNPQQLYGVLGETLKKLHQKRFEQEQSPDGKDWKPLQSWYKATKRNNKKLQESGLLRNTLAYNIKNDGVEFGSAVKYARLHQFGGEIKPKRKKMLKLGNHGFAKKVKVPARPWLGISDADEKFLLKKANTHLQRQIDQILR